MTIDIQLHFLLTWWRHHHLHRWRHTDLGFFKNSNHKDLVLTQHEKTPSPVNIIKSMIMNHTMDPMITMTPWCRWIPVTATPSGDSEATNDEKMHVLWPKHNFHVNKIHFNGKILKLFLYQGQADYWLSLSCPSPRSPSRTVRFMVMISLG